jgi:hypothetical protein
MRDDEDGDKGRERPAPQRLLRVLVNVQTRWCRKAINLDEGFSCTGNARLLCVASI